VKVHALPKIAGSVLSAPQTLVVPHAQTAWDVPDTSDWLLLEMGQAWLKEREARFRAGQVRLAVAGTDLLVFADLEDDDVYCPAAMHNEPAFLRGDVFELFLSPAGQGVYYEFHVNPANVRYQLRLTPREGDGKLVRDVVWAEPVVTQTRMRAGGWQAYLRVKLGALMEPEGAAVARRWEISCGRYDWARDYAKPVLSSTSPHKVLNFHRRHEWRQVEW